MAKKRAKRPSQASVAAPAVARPAAAPLERPAPRSTDLAAEYRYVYGDLKRIGILAASMFALLIVLALLAQYVF